MMRVVAELFRGAAAHVTNDPVAANDPGAADQKLVDALMRLMGDERFTVTTTSQSERWRPNSRVPEYKLRRLINQRLGYRNFNVFLNNYRIAEAKAASPIPPGRGARDYDRDGRGIQSLGPFNRAFKAITGVTPTEYRPSRPARLILNHCIAGIFSKSARRFQFRPARFPNPASR